jgi:hypothetical protein
MSSVIYQPGVRLPLIGGFQWGSTGDSTFRVALVDNSIDYTPDPDNETRVEDIFDGQSASEYSDPSYDRQTLSFNEASGSPAGIVTDLGNDRIELHADDVVFPDLEDNGDDVKGVLVFWQQANTGDAGGDDASADRPIAYFEGGEFPSTPNGTNFAVDWSNDDAVSAGRVLTYSYSPL